MHSCILTHLGELVEWHKEWVCSPRLAFETAPNFPYVCLCGFSGRHPREYSYWVKDLRGTHVIKKKCLLSLRIKTLIGYSLNLLGRNVVDEFVPFEEQILLYFFYYFTLNIIFFPQLQWTILYATFQLKCTVELKNDDATTQEVMVPILRQIM